MENSLETSGYKSSYMLENLVNSALLVYNHVTSNNEYSFAHKAEQDNQQERLVLVCK